MRRNHLTAFAAVALVFCAASATAHPRPYAHAHGVTPRVIVTPGPRVVPRCAGGNCSATVTATGTNGHTITGSGGASCADGSCTRSRSVTGPGGETRIRTLSISR